MNNLKEAMSSALQNGIAIGHFNISDSNQLNGIAAAAQSLKVPVIIGVSEGESKFLGLTKMVAMVRAAGKEFGIDIYTNADHTHSVEGCKLAIDAGMDSVIFDGSKLSVEENIASTKEVVEYANQVSASRRSEIIVEGEVGYIGTSSKMLDEIPDDISDSLPTPEDVKSFIDQTGATAVAPAVGNLHGMLKGRANPALNIELVKSMRNVLDEATGMVLHGGSGLTDEDFTAAIAAGINVVHINTEIRVAYREGIEAALAENLNEVAPYRYLNGGRNALQEVVTARLVLFNNL